MQPRFTLTLLLSLFFLPVRSQLQVGAELRPRVLVDNGYGTLKTAGTPALAYVTQRTRLNVRFKGELFETYISFQDVRFWGGDNNYKSSGAYGTTGTLSLHQGWFMVTPAPWISVKAGRQLFSYDDQRILSSRGWNDYQVTYDAVLVKVAHEGHRVDLGLSWNAESSSAFYVPLQKFKTIDFLRYEGGGERLRGSLIGLVTGNSVSDTTDLIRYRATWGGNMTFHSSLINVRSSLYYQHHLNDAGSGVSAWAASLHAGTFLIPDHLSWNAGVDYVSGQDGISTSAEYLEKNHAFDLLYGRRHAWYGYMDYFSNMPVQGLQDYVFQAEYTPNGKLTLQADYHLFWLAARPADPESPGETLNKRLGDELDLTLIWQINKTAALQAGYSLFLTRPTLEVIKGVEGEELKFPQFAYLMLTLTPSFNFEQGGTPGR